MENFHFREICIGCMSKIEKEAEICPNCGIKIEKYQAEPYHLKPYTILDKKYLVGKVTEEKNSEILYIGWDLNLKVKVAIKEYYPKDLATREKKEKINHTLLSYKQEDKIAYQKGLKEFVEEAKELAKFSQFSAVVPIKDFFKENNTAYIITEYIEGITIQDYLKQIGEKIELNTIFELLKPLMESLFFIHNLGIVHGNINLTNIIITRYNTAKLINFKVKEKIEDPFCDICALCNIFYKTVTTLSLKEKEVLLRGINLEVKNRYKNIKEFIQALDKIITKKEKKNNFFYLLLPYRKKIIGTAIFIICTIVFLAVTILETTDDKIQTLESKAGVSKNASFLKPNKKMQLSISYSSNQKTDWNLNGKGNLELRSDSIEGEETNIAKCMSRINVRLNNTGTLAVKEPTVVLKFQGLILCKNNNANDFSYSDYKTDAVSQFSGYCKVIWKKREDIKPGNSSKFWIDLDDSIITNSDNAKVKITLYTKNQAIKSYTVPIQFVYNNTKTEIQNYKNNFYILPDSNKRYLTEKDLYGLSKGELRIARNEIFARKGRIFEDTQLQLYFDSMSWYRGIYYASEFSYDFFNEYEETNIDFIKKYEAEN